MSEVAESGRTVIFVSHNMGAIKNLCSRAVLLDGGQVLVDGDVDNVVEQYLISSSENGEWHTQIADRMDRKGNGALRFTGFQIRDSKGDHLDAVVSGDSVEFVLFYERMQGRSLQTTEIYLWIRDAFTKGLLRFGTDLTGQSFGNLPQQGAFICKIVRFPFRSGQYYLDLGANVDGVKADRVVRAVVLDVVDGDYYGSGKVPTHPNDGFVLSDHHWEVEKTEL